MVYDALPQSLWFQQIGAVDAVESEVEQRVTKLRAFIAFSAARTVADRAVAGLSPSEASPSTSAWSEVATSSSSSSGLGSTAAPPTAATAAAAGSKSARAPRISSASAGPSLTVFNQRAFGGTTGGSKGRVKQGAASALQVQEKGKDSGKGKDSDDDDEGDGAFDEAALRSDNDSDDNSEFGDSHCVKKGTKRPAPASAINATAAAATTLATGAEPSDSSKWARLRASQPPLTVYTAPPRPARAAPLSARLPLASADRDGDDGLAGTGAKGAVVRQGLRRGSVAHAGDVGHEDDDDIADRSHHSDLDNDEEDAENAPARRKLNVKM